MDRILFILCIFSSSLLLGNITFEDTMTYYERERTGINHLSPMERDELESWINHNFEYVGVKEEEKEPLFLSFNYENGSKIELSDGSTYEIAPEDRMYSAYWITPFPVHISESNHSEYPIKITNQHTDTSVNAKLISKKEVYEQEKKRAQDIEAQKEALVKPRAKPGSTPSAQSAPTNKPDKNREPLSPNVPNETENSTETDLMEKPKT